MRVFLMFRSTVRLSNRRSVLGSVLASVSRLMEALASTRRGNILAALSVVSCAPRRGGTGLHGAFFDHRTREPMDVRVINELVHKQSAFVEKLNAEVGKVIVGQKAMIERIL